MRAILTAACLAGFAVMLVLVSTGRSAAIDDPVRTFFYEMRTDRLNSIVSTFTHLGDWYIISLICVIFLLIKQTRFSFGIPLACGSASVTVLNKSIKHLVARPRPADISHLVEADGFSFTSGHSIASMFLFALLIWLVHKHVRKPSLQILFTVPAAIPMIGIGLSRIYCGVHYPTDVLGGWFLGLAAMLITSCITDYVISYNSTRRPPPTPG